MEETDRILLPHEEVKRGDKILLIDGSVMEANHTTKKISAMFLARDYIEVRRPMSRHQRSRLG